LDQSDFEVVAIMASFDGPLEEIGHDSNADDVPLVFSYMTIKRGKKKKRKLRSGLLCVVLPLDMNGEAVAASTISMLQQLRRTRAMN
jgi:hypothetical protein